MNTQMNTESDDAENNEGLGVCSSSNLELGELATRMSPRLAAQLVALAKDCEPELDSLEIDRALFAIEMLSIEGASNV